jgi:UDP-2,3-diacylglucosamine hydrolase
VRLYFLSDLHIGHQQESFVEVFFHFLDQVQKEDALILGGDIFDLLVGPHPYFLQKYSKIIQKIDALGQAGIQVYFIEGNHDFFLRPVFQHIQVVEKEVTIEFAGKKFFCTHGDLANPRDYGYRTLRSVLRSKPFFWFVQCLSVTQAEKVATTLQKCFSRSAAGAGYKDPASRTIYRSYAAQRLQEGCDFVLMGHTHDLDEMHFMLADRPGQYINAGFPKAHRSFLMWEPGEKKIARCKLY